MIDPLERCTEDAAKPNGVDVTIVDAPTDEASRKELQEGLASNFRDPETAPWNWEALREGKRRAWSAR